MKIIHSGNSTLLRSIDAINKDLIARDLPYNYKTMAALLGVYTRRDPRGSLKDDENPL